MTVTRHTRKLIDEFDRALTLTATPEGGTGWTVTDTSSAGTPTYATATADGGAMILTCAANSEAEILTMSQNDILMYDLDYLQHMWWVVKVAGIDAVTTLVMGLGSARNDTSDTVATSAWFRMEGSASTTAVVVETDDNVGTPSDDVATGVTLAAVYKKFHIDFTNGLADVRFYVDGERVAADTTFDMSNKASGQNVQPLIQIQKASGTGVPAISIAQFGVQYEYSYGA